MACDYLRDFADRRAFMLREPSTRQRDIFAGLKLGPVRTSQTGRGMFDGLRLSVAQPNAAPERTPLDRAVERYARAAGAILPAPREGGTELPPPPAALEHAGRALAERGRAQGGERSGT